ncbi:putative Transcriptional adapter 1, partial [Daphnia magna]
LCQPSPYVYHGVKHKSTVVSWVDKIRPTVVHQRKVKSCKIKPITVTRQAQPNNKPLGVNFHMLTSKSSFSVATFRFLVQSESLNCVTVAKISPYPTLVSSTVEC